MLPTVSNPAVLELEDEAAVNIQLLAVSLPAAAMNADHAAVIICEQVLQFGLEGPSRLLSQPAEVGKAPVAALVVAGDELRPGVCHDALSSKSSVSVSMSPELKAS